MSDDRDLKPDNCIACGHHRALHAPIGATEQEPGAKCCTCQCPGLELAETTSTTESAHDPSDVVSG